MPAVPATQPAPVSACFMNDATSATLSGLLNERVPAITALSVALGGTGTSSAGLLSVSWPLPFAMDSLTGF